MKLPASWSHLDFDSTELERFLAQERAEHAVYPPEDAIFAAFELCAPSDVRVVILGQDPYHGPGQAHGLSFSVKPPTKPPPSLRNIYKELHSDLGIEPVAHGDLTPWAKQGVLLLNTVLTVRHRKAGSHRRKGWEALTDAAISTLAAQDDLVFVLWGKAAQEKAEKLDANRHLLLTSPHPSPYSAHTGFFGSKPFSAMNTHLQSKGRPAIDWALPPQPPA